MDGKKLYEKAKWSYDEGEEHGIPFDKKTKDAYVKSLVELQFDHPRASDIEFTKGFLKLIKLLDIRLLSGRYKKADYKGIYSDAFMDKENIHLLESILFLILRVNRKYATVIRDSTYKVCITAKSRSVEDIARLIFGYMKKESLAYITVTDIENTLLLLAMKNIVGTFLCPDIGGRIFYLNSNNDYEQIVFSIKRYLYDPNRKKYYTSVLLKRGFSRLKTIRVPNAVARIADADYADQYGEGITNLTRIKEIADYNSPIKIYGSAAGYTCDKDVDDRGKIYCDIETGASSYHNTFIQKFDKLMEEIDNGN